MNETKSEDHELLLTLMYDRSFKKPVIALDVETLTLANEHKGGWKEIDNFGVACCVAYLVTPVETPPGSYIAFVDDVTPWATQNTPKPQGIDIVWPLADLAMMLRRMVYDGGTIIGWNALGFDRIVLEGEFYKRGLWADGTKMASTTKLTFADVMIELTARLGFRPHLDSVSQENGGPKKQMDATLAPILWRQGEKNRVIEYCRGDVEATMFLARKWYANNGGLTIPSYRKGGDRIFVPRIKRA